jgi:hypothetical protein
MSLAFGDVTRDGYGYGSILRAIERLILMRSPTLPNQYQANFEGITRALWDLGTVLSGTVPPPATSVIGPLPPNWNTATGGYNAGGTPGDGSFWFDTRMCRMTPWSVTSQRTSWAVWWCVTSAHGCTPPPPTASPTSWIWALIP